VAWSVQWPAWADTEERQRRWLLVVLATLFTYGWSVGEQLDSKDRHLVQFMAHGLFSDDALATGEGHVTPEQRTWMEEQGLVPAA
jgi:hypothetical protein